MPNNQSPSSLVTSTYQWASLRKAIIERDDHTCQQCGAVEGDEYEDGTKVRLEVDHIKPLSMNGEAYDETNLTTLCMLCNRRKGGRYNERITWINPLYIAHEKHRNAA